MANDLDQAASNAIAGGVSFPVDAIAWLLRKSGLPGDYSKPVLGSDWMKEKGLTKDVAPGVGQVVGETVGSLVDPLAPISKAAALGKTAQAMLYAGALRKDLITSTTAHPRGLLSDNGLVQELYHPSFAITKNETSPFRTPAKGGSNSVTLVPHYNAVDPKITPSVIAAFDAFTPRYHGGLGARIDEAFKDLMDAVVYKNASPAEQAQIMLNLKKDLIAGRLEDRFISRRAKGGIGGESARNPHLVGLPQYGKGGFDPTLRKYVDISTAPDALMQASYGHRFPTFQAYEKSKYGAGRLDTGLDAMRANFNANKVAEKLVAQSGHPFAYQLGELEPEAVIYTLKEAAQMGNAKAQKALDYLRRTKSEYGELKRYGPMQLNPDNFAGAIVDMGAGVNYSDITAELLRKRDIPVLKHDLTQEELLDPKYKQQIFDAADAMQQGKY